jgi:hypothetical protein
MVRTLQMRSATLFAMTQCFIFMAPAVTLALAADAVSGFG